MLLIQLLPTVAGPSQCQGVVDYLSKSILFSAAASRGVLNRIGFAK
jgi:hypothetical protein